MQVFTTSQFNDVNIALMSGKAIKFPTTLVWDIIAPQEVTEAVSVISFCLARQLNK